MIIRQETLSDYLQVVNVIEAAFAQMEDSDHSEHELVSRLRRSTSFIPELSLVAELDDHIVGHILFTKVKVIGGHKTHQALALAPVSVHPEYQNRGIGSALILEGHRIARTLGHSSIVLLGHEDYYPRFGYRQAADYGIEFPFPVPEENCMVLDLQGNGIQGIKGVVEYPAVFFAE